MQCQLVLHSNKKINTGSHFSDIAFFHCSSVSRKEFLSNNEKAKIVEMFHEENQQWN